MTDRDTWLAERRKGIGGSDWQHVLNIEPYGCARRLWYDKRDTEPDYPQRETGPMRRGTALEPLVAAEFEAQTGRKTRIVGRLPSWPEKPPWLLGTPDRAIVGHKGAESLDPRPGVLEIKTINEWRWRKLWHNRTLPESWTAQLQHYLLLMKRSWGAFAVLEPTNWKYETFPLEADKTLQELMLRSGERFWAQVENGPAPAQLDASDKRCAVCPWRRKCQGNALDLLVGDPDPDVEDRDDATLAQLVSERQQIGDLIADAKAALEATNANILNQLGGWGKKVRCSGHRVYSIESVRRSLDLRALRRELPEIAEKYEKKSVVRTLRVYPA